MTWRHVPFANVHDLLLLEQKLACAELEIKSLLEAFLRVQGYTRNDFGSKEELKEFVDAQVGTSFGCRGKPYIMLSFKIKILELTKKKSKNPSPKKNRQNKGRFRIQTPRPVR